MNRAPRGQNEACTSRSFRIYRGAGDGQSGKVRFTAGRSSQMSTNIIWHGTQEESFALVNAIARNCTCQFGLMGVRLSTCTSHRMLTEDQHALNGLLFARRV